MPTAWHSQAYGDPPVFRYPPHGVKKLAKSFLVGDLRILHLDILLVSHRVPLGNGISSNLLSTAVKTKQSKQNPINYNKLRKERVCFISHF